MASNDMYQVEINSIQLHVDKLVKAIEEQRGGENLASLHKEHLKEALKKLEEAKTAQAKRLLKKVSVEIKLPLPVSIDDLDKCHRKFVIKLNNCPR